MSERPDARRKRFDLSVAQVTGTALAAVVAAKLASYFGVYGTILGAGVVSVIATCGGSVLQHFFRRTGEQIREATGPARLATPVTTRGSRSADEFTEGTVYRARVRSWKRPLIGAALVFGITMTGITAYELVSGNSFSGGGGTTVSDAVTGDDGPSPRTGGHAPASPAPHAPSRPADGATPWHDTPSSHGTTPSPTATDSTPASPTPSASATSPAPSSSSRSENAVQGQVVPGAP